jgi:hypothetical protein
VHDEAEAKSAKKAYQFDLKRAAFLQYEKQLTKAR